MSFPLSAVRLPGLLRTGAVWDSAIFSFKSLMKLEPNDFGGISTSMWIGSGLPLSLRFSPLPVAQRSENLSAFSALLSAEHFAPLFGRKGSVEFAISACMRKTISAVPFE